MINNLQKILFSSLVILAIPFIGNAISILPMPSPLFILYQVLFALLPFFLVLVIPLLFWGIFRFAKSKDDLKKKKTGRNVMIFSLIILFVYTLLTLVGYNLFKTGFCCL